MKSSIKLATISKKQYPDYKYETIFKAYKWDPQIEDHNTVSKHVVLMDGELANQLEVWAEQLSMETIQMEEILKDNLHLSKELGFTRKFSKRLKLLSNYKKEQHVRLMRFDFHPTDTGWAVSEVNSDVPGGLAEASILPQIAAEYFEGYAPHYNIAQHLLSAYEKRIPKNGKVAFVHATSYSDDRQVMQFIGDYFEKHGYHSIYTAPDHIRWEKKKAYSILEGQEGEIDGIIRFFPLEWLENLPKSSKWEGYYDCLTPSCNHPVAIFAQSKRLPLIWDNLGVSIPTWKELLPETKDPKFLKQVDNQWILKPALGRVGEGISIKEVISAKELKQIEKAAKKEPESWIAQRRFMSSPLITEEKEEYHLCIGVFTVDGKCAGFYGRISPYPRIDANAKDIPVLVLKN
jgi:Glutathionylspermidine synthase